MRYKGKRIKSKRRSLLHYEYKKVTWRKDQKNEGIIQNLRIISENKSWFFFSYQFLLTLMFLKYIFSRKVNNMIKSFFHSSSIIDFELFDPKHFEHKNIPLMMFDCTQSLWNHFLHFEHSTYCRSGLVGLLQSQSDDHVDGSGVKIFNF